MQANREFWASGVHPFNSPRSSPKTEKEILKFFKKALILPGLFYFPVFRYNKHI